MAFHYFASSQIAEPNTAARKTSMSMDELQVDLDAWLIKYNQQRPHSGRYCYGKTPMETFNDSLAIAKEKMLNSKHDKSSLTAMAE